jgi:hypothetical protein
LVDPVPTDGLGEDVDSGVVLVGGHIGMVGEPTSGHRGVDPEILGGCVDEEERGVDGAAATRAQFRVRGVSVAR